MLNLDEVMRLIGRWSGTVKFFPSDAQARIGIAEQIAGMASNEDQVRWLVKRIPTLYREWPPMLEVRAVFCAKFRPLDGIEADSEVYTDGIPSESSSLRPQIAVPELRQLSGECVPVSSDPEMAKLIAKVAAANSKRLPVVQIDVRVRAGEDEYSALVRSCCEHKERAMVMPYTPSQEQIELIKAEQEWNRKESVQPE